MKDEIRYIKERFEKFLKNKKGMQGYAGVKNERKKYISRFNKILEDAQYDYKELITLLKKNLEEGKNEEELKILQTIKDFLETEKGFEKHISPEDKNTTGEYLLEEMSDKQNTLQIIGRVAPALNNPSTPVEFTFWVKDDHQIHVEIGDIITAYYPGEEEVSVTGIVSDLWAISDIREVVDSFYGHALGEPEKEMPTRLPVILSGKAEIIKRSDGRMEPIRGSWPVRFATRDEIIKSYGSDIPDKFRILSGFTYDDKKQPVPIVLDARYVLGYEAAHVNISGASGVATKTSYALFLLFSILAYSHKAGEKVAAIAFNVKEADLMFIDNLPSWEEISYLINNKNINIAKSAKLWLKAKKEYGLDPLEWVKEGLFKFHAPTHYSSGSEGKALSQRQQNIETFNYSLKTLVESSTGALFTLFDPQDLDEKAIALIYTLGEIVKERNDINTFKHLIDYVSNLLTKKPSKDKGNWIKIGSSLHHTATVTKILNRLNHVVNHQLKGVVVKSESSDHPIRLEELKPGELWVIDITQLTDKGQRLVFQTVVRKVFQLLEERKSSEITGEWNNKNLKNFPKHVIIFVDELNKFVPAGREFSELKREIIEIAARGRSFGLSLCGAQQLASKIDEEVLANTSTFVVGRTHPVEIKKPPYAWIPEGLKQKVTIIDKGWMLLWHTIHKRPVLIHFPMPLHRIKEHIESSGG